MGPGGDWTGGAWREGWEHREKTLSTQSSVVAGKFENMLNEPVGFPKKI